MENQSVTFESILQRYMSDTMSLRSSYDWINNDLCRMLFQTRFGKECLFDMTDEEQQQYYNEYPVFEEYETIDIHDNQMQKQSLQEQMTYFTSEQLNQLGFFEYQAH